MDNEEKLEKKEIQILDMALKGVDPLQEGEDLKTQEAVPEGSLKLDPILEAPTTPKEKQVPKKPAPPLQPTTNSKWTNVSKNKKPHQCGQENLRLMDLSK